MNASQQFAQWLQETHPEVYEALFAHSIAQRSRLAGFGDDTASLGLDFNSEPDTSLVQDIPVDQNNLDYVTASAYGDAVDALPGDLSVGLSNQPMSSTQGVTGSATSTGNWLTSPPGLTAIAQLGTAVLGTVATAEVAKTQMAVIQAQAQRAANNQPPAPISYIAGTNGQPVPVYVSSSGQQLPTSIVSALKNGLTQPVTLSSGSTGYTLNSSTLSSVLGGNNFMWLLLGAGLFLALLAGQS